MTVIHMHKDGVMQDCTVGEFITYVRDYVDYIVKYSENTSDTPTPMIEMLQQAANIMEQQQQEYTALEHEKNKLYMEGFVAGSQSGAKAVASIWGYGIVDEEDDKYKTKWPTLNSSK